MMEADSLNIKQILLQFYSSVRLPLTNKCLRHKNKIVKLYVLVFCVCLCLFVQENKSTDYTRILPYRTIREVQANFKHGGIISPRMPPSHRCCICNETTLVSPLINFPAIPDEALQKNPEKSRQTGRLKLSLITSAWALLLNYVSPFTLLTTFLLCKQKGPTCNGGQGREHASCPFKEFP